ncbi:LacI family DNA-binding transcriptional regulator [Membranihabitans marinus]|nr:LacI family DNA-binding transcriptional regulator [Membranihabitans marinus]
MEDIAQSAGVALSTVSRALNNDTRISLATRKRIQKIAKEMGFKKNILASGLMTNRTNIIGVVIPQINRAFFSSIIYSMEETANQMGFSLIICQSADSYLREKEKVETLLALNVDGIVTSIAVDSKDMSHFERARELGTPVLFFDRIPKVAFPVSTILIEDAESAYQGTVHLIKQGYTKIAHLAGPTELHIFAERLEGYKKALTEYNLPICDEYIRYHKIMSHEEGRDSTEALLHLKNPPNAIFCANNLMAISAVFHAIDQGYRVPEDLGIIGFSEEPSSALMRPGISSIKQPSIEMGKMAIEMIIKEITAQSQKESFDHLEVILPTQINIRQSSLKKG